jgi:hypothetical protein
LPNRRQPLGFDCPKCGRNYGSLRIKTIRRNREKLIQKGMQVLRNRKNDYGKIIKQNGVKRNLHVHKYDTFFGDFDPERKPDINAPLPDPCDKSYLTNMNAIENTVIAFSLFLIMIPLIVKKYPDLAANSGILGPYIRAFIEYGNSFTDGRWDRSMTEWVHIINYAKAHGYNAASRKFFAKKDGKEKYLSPNYIKQKTKIIDKFLGYFENDKDGEVFHNYMMEVNKKLESDKELLSIRNGFLEHIYEIADELSNISNTYSYDYYYIRHYDACRYKKSRSDSEQGSIKKRSQLTGKIECGPFKKVDLPFAAQTKRHNANYDRLLEILTEPLVLTKLGIGSNRISRANHDLGTRQNSLESSRFPL